MSSIEISKIWNVDASLISYPAYTFHTLSFPIRKTSSTTGLFTPSHSRRGSMRQMQDKSQPRGPWLRWAGSSPGIKHAVFFNPKGQSSNMHPVFGSEPESNMGQRLWTPGFTPQVTQGQASWYGWCKAWNIKEMQSLFLCNATPGLCTYTCDEHTWEKKLYQNILLFDKNLSTPEHFPLVSDTKP